MKTLALTLALSLPLLAAAQEEDPADAVNPQVRILFFTLPGCVPCQILKRELREKHPEVRMDPTRAADIQVCDITERIDLKRKYGLGPATRYPYLIAIRPDGRPLAAARAESAAVLVAWLHDLRKQPDEPPPLRITPLPAPRPRRR